VRPRRRQTKFNMSAVLRGVLSRSAPVLRCNVTQKATIVSGPPRVRVSFAEKATLGGLMIIAIISPSGYILANIKNYRDRPTAD